MKIWKITSEHGTVTGSEEYVRSVAQLLDALDPPISYKIEGPTA